MDSDGESKDRIRDRSRDRQRRDRDRDRGSRFSDKVRDRSNDRGGRGEPRSMKSSSNRVFVSNIPYEYRWQDMKDLFRQEVGEVQFVELFVDENDKPKGSGIVEFADAASVKKCLDLMQRYEVKGRKLVIKEDTGNMRDKHGNLSSRRGREDRYRDDHRDIGMRGPSDEGKYGNTYGLSPQFLESLHIDCPLSNRVFVANVSIASQI
ncbi:unnamed protein product [Acanthoscelides obtectus]|uniref:RRM domain-containing protein n=1 Tax=Acanthoscelides obtectus TaxID=200917 RepID=A0A9P0LVE4_ACAOB|nr:unnamed protein product [Acanthoscelides obtectus]CAK1642377.1 Myelin expression factor 2 [Acanthoscelides obtectus]